MIQNYKYHIQLNSIITNSIWIISIKLNLYKFNKHNPITINNDSSKLDVMRRNAIFKKNVMERISIFWIPNKKTRSYKRKKKNIEDRFEFHGKSKRHNRISIRHIERKYGTRMNDDSATSCNFAGWRWIQWRADRQSWWLRNQDPK